MFAFLDIRLSAKHKQNVEYMSNMLKQHMVRRTKRSLQNSLTILPQKENRVVLQFSEPERALYDYLERVLYKKISNWRKQGQGDYARSAASLLYLRLKQGKYLCGFYETCSKLLFVVKPAVTIRSYCKSSPTWFRQSNRTEQTRLLRCYKMMRMAKNEEQNEHVWMKNLICKKPLVLLRVSSMCLAFR